MPDVGLEPRPLGSGPEPKPGTPGSGILLGGLSEEGLLEEPSERGEGAGHVFLAAALSGRKALREDSVRLYRQGSHTVRAQCPAVVTVTMPSELK